MGQTNKETLHIPHSDSPRLVIIGGGFAGLNLAKNLKEDKLQIVLLDRHNYHTFQPLLYQVATAGLEPDSIAEPLRKVIEKRHDFFFRMAIVQEILPDQQIIITNEGKLEFDYLVIATGTETNYFGIDSIEKHAFQLKKVTNALDLRSHILQNFEKAVMQERNQEELEELLNFVIVGGGPTGVELAGALAELKKNVLPNDYPELNFDKMNIYLLEGLPQLLNGMSEESASDAVEYLQQFGVDVKLETMVKGYDGSVVDMGDKGKLKSNTLIWAAGVKGKILTGLDSEEHMEKSRYKVNVYQQINGYESIFAIGDIALMETQDYPKGHPQLAQVAIQQGEQLAKNIRSLLKGKSMLPFEYQHKGAMATIGRNKAVVDLPGGRHFGGFFAWFLWMAVHLFSLAGFRSKLVTFSNWVWNYFTYDRSIRLIIRPLSRKDNRVD